jgi:putative peptidoglycan lipid II flippase
MLAFVISNLTGLVRDMLITAEFGASLQLDSFWVANRVPDTLFNLVAGGALASAFIPTFTTLLTRGQPRQAWKLASAIANWVLLVLITASLLAALFAPQVVSYLLASGYRDDPQMVALTVRYLRMMLPAAAIFGLSGLVMGILNSRQVFLVPALTPSMYNLGMIFGVLVLAPTMGLDGLVIGVLIGASLHLLVQLPTLLRQRGQYFPGLGLDLPETREVGRLMLPRLLGVAVLHLNFWVNTNLATYMEEGSPSALQFGFRLMLMPQAVLAQSIAIAVLPTFSAQAARGRLDDLRSALAASLRGVLLLSLPASLGLMLLHRPLVVLVYERGQFDPRSTDLVAWALLWYAAGLVGHALVEVLARSFYALHDTRTPVIIGASAMGLNVALSLLFAYLFTQIGWMPHGGLALANSLATGIEAVGLLVLMRRRLGGVQGRLLARGLLQALFAGGLMTAGLALWLGWAGASPAWLVVGVGVLLGVALYALGLLVLRVEEFRELLAFLRRRVRLG